MKSAKRLEYIVKNYPKFEGRIANTIVSVFEELEFKYSVEIEEEDFDSIISWTVSTDYHKFVMEFGEENINKSDKDVLKDFTFMFESSIEARAQMKARSGGYKKFTARKIVLLPYTVKCDGEPIDPHTDIKNISNGRIAWGTPNSATYQLALAILVESSTPDYAIKYYEKFAEENLLNLVDSSWEMTSSRVHSWLANQIRSIKKKTFESESDNIVKRACKELGTTQKELADMLDVPQQTVSRWSNDEIPKMAQLALELLLENKSLKSDMEILKKAHEILHR